MKRGAQPLAITHRQHRPHFESRPYRPSPARREAIHGRVQPSDELVRFGRRVNSTKLACLIALVAVLIFAAQLARLI